MLQRDEARESLKHIGEYGTEEILHLKDDDPRARHSLAGKWNGSG